MAETSKLYAAMPDGTGPGSATIRKRVLAASNGHPDLRAPDIDMAHAMAAAAPAPTVELKLVQDVWPGRLCQECTGGLKRRLALRVRPNLGGYDYYCLLHDRPGTVADVPVVAGRVQL